MIALRPRSIWEDWTEKVEMENLRIAGKTVFAKVCCFGNEFPNWTPQSNVPCRTGPCALFSLIRIVLSVADQSQGTAN